MKANPLFEILVPTIYGDTLKPISTKHHKEWDKRVRAITGGLTILSPAKGQWMNEGVLYGERVIPVRIMCSEKQISLIVGMTIQHYRQKAVMFYKITDDVEIRFAKDTK